MVGLSYYKNLITGHDGMQKEKGQNQPVSSKSHPTEKAEITYWKFGGGGVSSLSRSKAAIKKNTRF